jgi:hypothetical protein
MFDESGGGGEGSESGPEQAPAVEPSETKKEPTLEEQAAIYAEMFGEGKAKILERAKSLQAEMSEEDKRDLTMLIYCPENFGTREAAKKCLESGLRVDPYRYDYFYDERRFKTIVTEGETKKGIVAFGRYSGSRDDISEYVDKTKLTVWSPRPEVSVEDLEKTGQRFMSPKLWLLASIAYFKATGRHMDQGYGQAGACVCPGSRYHYNRPNYKGYAPLINRTPESGKDVPLVFYDAHHDNISASSIESGRRFGSSYGPRRILFKEF